MNANLLGAGYAATRSVARQPRAAGRSGRQRRVRWDAIIAANIGRADISIDGKIRDVADADDVPRAVADVDLAIT